MFSGCDSAQKTSLENVDPCYLDPACSLGVAIPSSLLRSTVTITSNNATQAGYSGVLLNNVSGDETPYVLTARHTRAGQHDDLNESLDWLEFHIGYRNRTCGVEQPLQPCSQNPCCVQGGTVVATGAERDGWDGLSSRDFRLIRLSGPIPSGCQVAYSGWSLDTTSVVGGVAAGFPRGRPLAVALIEERMRGSSFPGAEGILLAPVAQGRLELGQSGGPLCTTDGRVLGVIRTSTPCPAQGTATTAPTLVHNWLHGPEGSRLVDHLADGDTTVRSLPSLE